MVSFTRTVVAKSWALRTSGCTAGAAAALVGGARLWMMPVAVSFLYGKGDLKTEFNAELDTSGKYGGKDDIVLKLTPKKPSAQYKSLFLVVDPNDKNAPYHVSQSVIVDASNNVNHFRFFAPDFEEPIKDAWFEFDPRSVPNYRIVDADQPPPAQGSALAPAPAKK